MAHLMLWLWLSLSAFAADAPESGTRSPQIAAELRAPDPVERWARVDIRADRRARAGLLITLAAPGLITVGVASLNNFSVSTNQRQFGLGFSLTLGGYLCAVVGPPLLIQGAWQSSRALRRQGLHVPPTFAIVGLGLYVASLPLLTTNAAASPQQAFFTAGAYIAAVGVGAVQLRRNQLARRSAGWLGVVPDPRSRGLAIVGTF